MDRLSGLSGLPTLALAGGVLRFGAAELIWRRREAPVQVEAWLARLGELREFARGEGAAGDVVEAWLARLGAPRAPVAGILLDRPRLVGVVNTTPDSFSDGGRYESPDEAIGRGVALARAGADIVDVGGESTRPDAVPVAVEVECARVLPVIDGLVKRGVAVSVDTRKSAVMAAALDAGACMVNDTSALAADPASLALIALRGCPVVLMHMRGTPADMRLHARYDCAPLDVYDELAARIAACEAAGIARARIIVDPGLGFAKAAAHNAEILSHLALYQGLGCAVMVGASRKGLFRAVRQAAPPEGRRPAS
ncbi:MAG: dihydropteroate synthase, partial [Alphaproteobacteria bacterium]